jgi:hypothetical protein
VGGVGGCKTFRTKSKTLLGESCAQVNLLASAFLGKATVKAFGRKSKLFRRKVCRSEAFCQCFGKQSNSKTFWKKSISCAKLFCQCFGKATVKPSEGRNVKLFGRTVVDKASRFAGGGCFRKGDIKPFGITAKLFMQIVVQKASGSGALGKEANVKLASLGRRLCGTVRFGLGK